jgi:hypothetical protein
MQTTARTAQSVLKQNSGIPLEEPAYLFIVPKIKHPFDDITDIFLGIESFGICIPKKALPKNYR